MGTQLQRQDSGFVSNHPGCMWSLMHILDYHIVKKMLPHRKHAGGRRIRCSGSRKATLKNRENGEGKELIAEVEPLLVKQHSTETSSAKKRSRKSQIDVSTRAKEVSKEESHKSGILRFSVQSWLRRTSEIHDVELSDDFSKTPCELVACNEKCTTEKAISPEKCETVMESSSSQKQMISNQLKKDFSHDQFYDHVDLLELFKANKEFFLKFLQDPYVNRNQFPGLHKSNTKVRLIKSSSFPVAGSSRSRNVRHSTLKHKQNEIWCFPKGEELVDNTWAPKLVTSESQEEDLPEGFSHRGWNQLVMSRFKDIKQKLMHTLQESKNKNTPTSIKTLLPEDPSGCEGKEVSETPEMTIGEERSKIDGNLDDNLGKRRLHRVSRTPSLDESLHKYSQLFESSCSSEAKLHHSTSLKLRSEEKVISTGINAWKSTRRNLSLPDLDALCFFLNGPPTEAFRLGIPVKNVEDHNASKENNSHIGPKSVSLHVDTDKSQRLEAILEREFQNSMEDTSDAEILHEYAVKPAEGESESCTMSPQGEQAQPSESGTREPYCSDYTTSQAELSMSEELCSSVKCEKTEIEEKSMDRHLPQFVVDKMDDSELNYVREVLELSGFIGDEYFGTWYSMDQPLDPSEFKELEVRCQHELDFTGKWDHQLLFDLVNETLVDIHETSYTYFPRALSYGGSKHSPMPKGQHLLEDVFTRISSYMSFRPELVKSLDDVVARDLAKGDRCMNLQWETEYVALELEDLIFEELLDEVICS